MVDGDISAPAPRIIVVGSSGGSHIGNSFVRACKRLHYPVRFCDVNDAWRLGTAQQKLYWHFFGKRPVRLQAFSAAVLRECDTFRPDYLIATGPVPVTRETLNECRNRRISCINFSTDDPFNPHMRMTWFLEALRAYDRVFTPRQSNMHELRVHGCRRVEYLAFGYDEELFYNPTPIPDHEESDLFFAGTADAGRAPYLQAAVAAGINIRLHGQYWEGYAQTSKVTRGPADIPALRKAIATCRVALCLVRHENRDGHSMRTFEVPAVGACMVVEDTEEHRRLFGADGENVIYFRTPAEMVAKTRQLLNDSSTRDRLRSRAHALITQGNNTYADRLRVMVEGTL